MPRASTSSVNQDGVNHTHHDHHHRKHHDKPVAAIKFAHEADKLSLKQQDASRNDPASVAVEAKFITSHDLVIETVDGGRLPAVPAHEAERLNRLRDEVEESHRCENSITASRGSQDLMDGDDGRSPSPSSHTAAATAFAAKQRSRSHSRSRSSSQRKLSTIEHQEQLPASQQKLDVAVPPAKTHPLFPPLPLYGPPSTLRNLQCYLFRFCAFWLSLLFLLFVVCGALVDGARTEMARIRMRAEGLDPDAQRKFHKEELAREKARNAAARDWNVHFSRHGGNSERSSRGRKLEIEVEEEEEEGRCDRDLLADDDEYPPLEGGKDALVCDVGYYARRVGLDVETFKVQTEDGFIITLLHVYEPKEYTPLPPEDRGHLGPDVFTGGTRNRPTTTTTTTTTADGSAEKRRYPVLLMHGLLQSAGAYCTNDDDSLAFILCKAGYDVWLGNNRCGMHPEHTKLRYSDPRMWAWNIRHLGVLDLAALISRVLYETGFEKLGLVCHSQGTTQTLVALAKEQRPELGERISVFCALAPAAYAGPLIEKMYFRFMRMISPSMFRIVFGIHAFIPFMMTMHSLLPPRLYGTLGYLVFSFLFGWTDDRWDRGLRHRMFQFAPVYVSAETMRWWLGRECFATQRCILSTREDEKREEEEYRLIEDGIVTHDYEEEEDDDDESRANGAWYDEKVPPMALWVAGSDKLVDGKRLLQRLQSPREPHVRIVHAKVIEEYEHLDVLWAMDAVDQVCKEVRDVIWMTVPEDVKASCRTPKGVKSELNC